MTKDEMKRNIMHRIMELRTKGMVEEDCILDVLDDNLDPYITDLEKQIEKMKCCGNCKHRYFIGDELECHLLDNGINCDNEDKWEIKENDIRRKSKRVCK